MAAAAGLTISSPTSLVGLDLLAGSLVLLLVLGIRNAWDMTVWIGVRTPTPPANQQ